MSYGTWLNILHIDDNIGAAGYILDKMFNIDRRQILFYFKHQIFLMGYTSKFLRYYECV